MGKKRDSSGGDNKIKTKFKTRDKEEERGRRKRRKETSLSSRRGRMECVYNFAVMFEKKVGEKMAKETTHK